MIGKDEFTELIQSCIEQDQRIDDLEKIFSYSFGDPIIDWGYKILGMLLNMYFTKEGADWIGYYLWENSEKCYYNENDEKLPLETINDLWNIVKKYRI